LLDNILPPLSDDMALAGVGWKVDSEERSGYPGTIDCQLDVSCRSPFDSDAQLGNTWLQSAQLLFRIGLGLLLDIPNPEIIRCKNCGLSI
jgi:hypothetical protein